VNVTPVTTGNFNLVLSFHNVYHICNTVFASGGVRFLNQLHLQRSVQWADIFYWSKIQGRIAAGAFHTSEERFDTHPGVLDDIMRWIQAFGRIKGHFGPAGAGKSAIAQTIAEMCAKLGLLIVSFSSPGHPVLGITRNVQWLQLHISLQLRSQRPDHSLNLRSRLTPPYSTSPWGPKYKY
jgi:hypothetical protein